MTEPMVDVAPKGDLAFAQKPPVTSNYTPKSVDEYIDLLEFSKTGQLYLATSSLNKRSWTGDLWWFNSPEDAPEAEKALTGYRIDSGIAQAKVINPKQLVLGLDSGALQLVTMSSTPHETRDTMQYFFDMMPSYCEHDDRITDLDTWPEDSGGIADGRANCVVTGGMDGRVIVWDTNMGITNMFTQVHPAGVTAVACNKEDNNVFATVGLDGKVKAWNLRNIKSCVTVYCDEMEPAGIVSWVPGQTGVLLVASRTGKIFLLDTETKTTSAHFQIMDREIKNIRWSIDRPELCAIAGDDVTFHVVKVEQQNISKHYSNSSHKDFVRGLAWHPTTGVLCTSGWDRTVRQHTIP